MKQTLTFASFVLSTALALSSTTRADAFSAPSPQTPAPKPAAVAPTQVAPADVIRVQLPSYPVKTCVVSGEELGQGGPILDHVVQGRLVRLCCRDCAKEIDKDPAPALKTLDAAVVAAQKSSYPLMTCPVTGEKLGDKTVDYVYGTRLVRLANAGVVAQFEKDPATAMAKVDKALMDAQRGKYTLKTCVISGEALGGEMGDPVDYLYGTTLVRFCCKSCVRKFEKEPEKYMKQLKSGA